MKKRSIYNINNVLLFILLFFGLFDVARNYTKLPMSFGYLKDIAIYLLILLNVGRLYLPKFFGKSFYAWAFSVIFFSPIGLINSGYQRSSVFIACLKFPEIFFLILLFVNWDKIFSIDFRKFIKYYVIGCALLCFVNVFGYYVDNPIVSVNMPNPNMPAGNYGGRVTVGQPPIAIFPVILAFVYLLIKANKKRERILLIIFLVCIIMSTSNTGILSVFAVFAVLLVYGLYYNKKNIKHNILLLLFCSLTGLLIVYLASPDFLQNIISPYINKIGRYFSGSTDSSMDIRKVHWKIGADSMGGLDYLIGKGAYGYITDEFYPIENTYVVTFLMYGAIGTLGMILFFVRLLFSSLTVKKGKTSKNNILLFCICIVFLMHMYTLDLYMCYTLYFSLAVFIAFCCQKEKKSVFKRSVIDCSVTNVQPFELLGKSS